ncbi:MAG: DNA-directed RNA polymerase subunit alpha [Rhabdochlamydiaceae bacterium]|nr:DNA-directed RNA polymerase subunit alpha [Rhabdochlamydiaceae bacterium]
MAVVYGNFELPSKIKVDESARKENFTRFIAEAFERSFGHTVGNALRRILLTCLEAPAIISIKIEGVPHEYMAVEGVVEDVTHIILNLKRALLRKLPSDEESGSRDPRTVTKMLDITSEMLEKGNGQYIVTLKDLMGASPFELVNPDARIFTVTKPMSRRVDLKVAIGRGYVPSERHAILDKVTDEIIIDSAFSPVRHVNYFVENTRVGQDTDYDRLILEVTTDGRVTPEEALTFATQIGVLHFQVFDQLKTHALTFDKGESEPNTDKDVLLAKLSLRINEIELSVRSTNCLSGANIDTIAELVIMPETEMLKFRNFGKKSLNEIKAKLEEMSLFLGMDLSKIGITRDNVKSVIDEYLQNKSGNETV